MSRGLYCGVFALAAVSLAHGAGYAQDPLKLPGKNYTVAFENSDVAVIRAHYGPHEKIPVHDHTSFSTIFVYLSDSGPVKINHEEDGKVEPVTRPPTVKGAYRVAPGIAERHSIENLGDQSSDFLRVELKHVSLTMKEPFRGKAPQNLSSDTDVVEFNNPAVQIERIVCVGTGSCPVKTSDAPSLVVAFTSFVMTSQKTHRREMVEAGAVRWLPADQGMSVKAEGDGTAHLLRILLPSTKP
jgi:quercetin dioxygenase-like cupin family protein